MMPLHKSKRWLVYVPDTDQIVVLKSMWFDVLHLEIDKNIELDGIDTHIFFKGRTKYSIVLDEWFE